jgi:phosphoglycolate phosphatase-like HAD superfamily hydrolase
MKSRFDAGFRLKSYTHMVGSSMAWIDDSGLGKGASKIEVVRPVGRREITLGIHDIDGTYSLIRDWPPVMSLSIHWAMVGGLNEDFDSEENAEKLVKEVGKRPLPETDSFCVESAGLCALTQMEYGIRRAVEMGNIPGTSGIRLTPAETKVNAQIIKRIWEGEERFDDVKEPAALKTFVQERTPRLFRLYEKILNSACRDRNTAEAWRRPEKWRVPGSVEFMKHLRECGVRNYFVTGAVIWHDGGIFEEVKALGFDIGPGRMVEAVQGSSWEKKMPKDEVIRELTHSQGVSPEKVLIVGDGRTEIRSGAQLGCVTISRLPREAERQRQLHIRLGANYVFEDFTDPVIYELIQR